MERIELGTVITIASGHHVCGTLTCYEIAKKFLWVFTKIDGKNYMMKLFLCDVCMSSHKKEEIE